MIEIGKVPYKYLQVGDPLVSLTGRHGKIVELHPEDDQSIVAEWEGENDKISWFHHRDSEVLYQRRITMT